MMELINIIAARAEKNAKISELDFVKDDILYCGNCNTPKQCKVEILGELRTFYCECKCGRERRDAYEAQKQAYDEAQKIERLKTSGIQDKQIHNWTFANDDRNNPAMSDKAMRYFSNWNQMYSENMGLLLWGSVGTGKTYFAACIANALIEKLVPVLMTNFAKIINAMSGFSIEDKNDYLNNFNNYKLLIIDDLGAERQSDFAQEIVYNVVDTRYKNGQPLIITTNMTMNEINNPKNITCSRIYDRILEMCVPVQCSGESRRKSAFQNKKDKARAIFR